MHMDFHHGETDEPLIPPWVYRLAAQWKVFVPLAIAIGTITFIVGQSRAYHYESKGFVSLYHDVSQYNAQRQAFYDAAQLQKYLEQRSKLNTPEGQYLVSSLSPTFISKHVVLSMPYGKDDARFLKDEDRSALISAGIDLTMQSTISGEAAAERLQLLAGFVVDQMLKQTLASQLRSKLLAARSKQHLLDNQMIETGQKLRELATRLQDTRQIAKRYPEADRLNNRQLLTTTGESGRFLSPMAQIIGLESDIATVKSTEEQLKRREKANAISLGFYEELYKRLPTDPTGEQILKGYLAEIKNYFGSMPPTDDVAREVYNDQLLLIQSVRSQDIAAPRFTSGPTVPPHMQGLPRMVLMMLAIVAGLGLAGAITLLLDALKAKGNQVPVPIEPKNNEVHFAQVSSVNEPTPGDSTEGRRCA